MFSFAMTSGLASDSDKFKIIITLRRAQKFGDSGPYKNFDFLYKQSSKDRCLIPFCLMTSLSRAKKRLCFCVCDGNVWFRRTGDDWNVLVRGTFGLEGRVGERNVGVFVKLDR